MLYRVIGRAGSGKTGFIRTLLEEKTAEGVPCVVIVPGQQSMEYEKDVFTLLGSRANLNTEVLTFERLPNRTYREYGGLAVSYADDGGRALLMAAAAENVADKLEAFSSLAKNNDFILKMLDTSRLLKENGLDESVFASVTGAPRTVAKASETALILGEYASLLKNGLGDSRDSLTLYAEALKKMPFFKGKTVFVDSFNSFTEQQHRVLDRIAAQCDDMYVSLCFDGSDRTGTFTCPRLSYERLGRFTRTSDILLPECHRYKKASLAHIEKELWNNCAPSVKDDGGVEFIECADKFSEAEAAASAVVRLTDGGYRYGDVVIIARSPDTYAGIIDTVLEKHGIPCFFSSGESLLIKPLSTFILSAIEAIENGYQRAVMKKLILSGYLPITEREGELVIRYADTWNIRGKSWVGESGWLMNPSGYKRGMTPYESSVLSVVNDAREKIASVLTAFALELKEMKTASDGAKAVYSLLESVNASETLRAKAEKLRKNGDEASSRKLVKLWDVVINSLDQLYGVIGDRSMTVGELRTKTELMLGEYSLGTVPAFCDSVVIGGASVFRGASPKAVILLGANDGAFPAIPALSSVFDENEIKEFELNGICFEESFDTRLDNEKLFFYTACTLPSEKLVCIYTRSNSESPSVGALRLRSLCPNAKTVNFADDEKSFVFSAASARENASFADPLARELLRKNGIDDIERAHEYPLCDPNAKFSAKRKSSMSLSPSRMERYAYCPFSYFGKYVLKLAENKKAEFGPAEIGTFIHDVLRIFVSERMKDGAFVSPDDETIAKRVDELTEDYIYSLCGKEAMSKRFAYAVSRLKLTLRLLLRNVSDELSSSDFVPVGFEAPAADGGYVYVTESGMKVRMNGVIDRVDEYVSNGKAYVRITDYKTGSKTFERKVLDYGLDMQMLLYMFAYNASHGDASPAAVLYLPAKLEKVENKPGCEYCPPDAETLGSEIEKNFKRKGLVTDDFEIIEALEHGRNKRFIPVTITGQNKFKANLTSIESAEGFGKLKIKTENCLKKIASLIADGEMKVSPVCYSESYNACTYCSFKAMCRLSDDISVRCKKGIAEDEENE